MNASRPVSSLIWLLCFVVGAGLSFSCSSRNEGEIETSGNRKNVYGHPDDGPLPAQNPNAKADAFRLFYKERSERAAVSLNRFGIAGDAVFANVFNKNYVAKTSNEYEVVPGPNDNNPIGKTVYNTWKLYQAIGGRTLELTLIRLFEGLVFNEQVSGHPGLTCREALPGWTRVMDGINGTVARTRFGMPVTPPVTYPATLEKEILQTFYKGLVFTYRENPKEYYFNFKAVNEFTDFAITWVFAETLPDHLRISDCCSSWMITPAGYLWEGAFWGNHNSRDNFTDYAMGYLAAFEAEKTPGLPADLAEAARRAADAGRRTGDAIVGAGMIQMTVGERGDYDTLIPGGHVRPDGSQEWQDLGSLASCTMVYAAQAISSEGLRHPVPELPVPGDVFSQGLQHIFDLIRLPLSAPVPHCTSIDDAFMGLRWQDILKLKLHGTPWYEVAEKISHIFPSLLIKLLGSTADDFQEMMLGAVALCYYAHIVGDDALYAEARQTLENLIQMTYHLTDLVYGIEMNPKLSAQAVRGLGKKPAAHSFSKAEKLYYTAALYGRMFDIDTPVEYFRNFDLGNNRIENIERHQNYPDTMPERLKTDKELYDLLFRPETGALVNHKQPWIAERYEERFGKMVPVRRTDDSYECIGPDGQWIPTENDRHRRFGNIELWYEAPLCSTETLHTLDCSWARLGCAPADLNDSGAVDAEDLDLFNNAWIDYGEGARCARGNDWCSGADLDQNGVLDADDRGYMIAAQGCKR